MAHYVKTEKIQCHYGEPKSDCPICNGSGWEYPLENDPEFKLPCRCRLEGMTFDEPVEELMLVEVEPLPDGGARVHIEDVPLDSN